MHSSADREGKERGSGRKKHEVLDNERFASDRIFCHKSLGLCFVSFFP